MRCARARNVRLCKPGDASFGVNCARRRLAPVVLMTMYNRAEMGLAPHHRFGAPVPTLDERVADIEGRLEVQSQSFDRLDTKVDRLEAKVDRLDGKFDRLDGKFEGLDAKFDAVGQRLDSRLDGFAQRLDARIDALDARVSRHFTWLVGIQVAVLIAILSASLR